jgi:hypothetical protein
MPSVEKERAPKSFVLGRDVVVSRVNLSSGIVPDTLARLICESRQGPPYNEKVHCPHCGKHSFLIPNPEGRTCGQCRQGVVEITWTTKRATQALLEGVDRGGQIHVATLNPSHTPVPIGLIEVLPCELLDLNQQIHARVAEALIRITHHRGQYAFVRHLIVHQDYGQEGVYYALLESIVRSSTDKDIPFVLLVAEESVSHQMCQSLHMPMVMRLGHNALLFTGRLRAC